MVPRPWRVPECARLVFPQRLDEVRYGVSGGELEPPARTPSDSGAPEHLRRHMEQDAQHGLDVCAIGTVSGRRGSRDPGTAARPPAVLRTAFAAELRRR